MTKKLIVTLLISIAMSFFAFKIYTFVENSKEKQTVTIFFNKGESLSHLATKLKNKDLILSEDLFKIQAVLLKYDKGLKFGEYELNNKMSGLDILEKINSGKVIYHKITIPEGLTVAEIFKVLENSDKLTGDISLDIKEGYLLPETYTFTRGDSRNSFVLQMKAAMDKALSEVWQGRSRLIDKQVKSKADLLKLASIVEKETIIDEEKPVVAKVYINRLKIRMRLQADPTVIYGATNYNGDITYKMLREKNDFNTYTIYGLPKTAIANPGIASLKAVARPADIDYLYFVADGKGGHVFTHTYKDHKVKVKEYLQKNKGRKQNAK